MAKDTVITLSLTIEEVNSILQAIQELPARIANPLSKKISEQGEAQVKAAQEPAVAE